MNRKIITGALAASSLFGALALAQYSFANEPLDGPPMPPPPHEMSGGFGQNRLDHMAAELGLTDAQKAQMQALFQQHQQAVKAAHQALKTGIEAILTPDQLAKMKAQRKAGRGGPGPGP